MDAALASIAQLLTPAVKEPLQHLIDNAPASIKQIVEALPHDLQRALHTPEGLVLLFASVLLATLLLASLLLRPSRHAKRNTIVIAGPCNAGKTALFSLLTDGSLHNGSVASMVENAGDARVSPPGGGAPRAVHLVDVPGHASMHDRLQARLSEAVGVVYVVDATDVTPHRTEAADLLFEVLSQPEVHRRRVPLLIACNKADLDADAHSKEFIRKTLEKQLDAMRKTRAAGMGKDAGGRVALGAPDKPFAFAGLRNRVALAEVSNVAGQLDDVRAFVVSCV